MSPGCFYSRFPLIFWVKQDHSAVGLTPAKEPRVKRNVSEWLKPATISKTLRIGFLPLNDCAPLVVAREFGLFKKYGLDVELRRRLSWRDIHQQFAYNELEAAHVEAALPFLINVGLTSDIFPTVTGMLLSLQGNAITISRELWDSGVHDPVGLSERLHKNWGHKTFTFAVDLPFSAEYFLLCEWLKQGGLIPSSQVRIIKASPVEMYPMLKLGYLDGYCAGEPWNSVAVQAGVGVCVATSATLAPLHADKALVVRQEFAERRSDEHELLIAALIEACEICDKPGHRKEIAKLLSRREYVDAPVEAIKRALVGPLDPKENGSRSLHGMNIFHGYHANSPTLARSRWLTGQMHRYFRWRKRPLGLDNVFKPDIFKRAKKLVRANIPAEEDAESRLAVNA
jgi:ABC-type nitrate/sulfonate/bicarbonate transport system substrate-binding protein